MNTRNSQIEAWMLSAGWRSVLYIRDHPDNMYERVKATAAAAAAALWIIHVEHGGVLLPPPWNKNDILLLSLEARPAFTNFFLEVEVLHMRDVEN